MFQKAKPIFLKGLAREMNITGVFTCDLPATKEKAVLRVTGATRFRVYLNGEMLHYGPARAAHGYFRVDEVELNLVSGGQLRIDAASYNVKGFDGVDHPGFVLAEVEAGGRVLAATGYDFAAFRNLSRLQRTMRYAFQRQFSEVYAGIDNLLPGLREGGIHRRPGHVCRGDAQKERSGLHRERARQGAGFWPEGPRGRAVRRGRGACLHPDRGAGPPV